MSADDLFMDCERIWAALSALADDEAGPAERAETERHLADCPSCRRTADRMATVTRRLRVRPTRPGREVAPELLALFDARYAGRPVDSTSLPSLRSLRLVLDGTVRPSCVPDDLLVWEVGAAACGCASGCGCGCQTGRTCRCFSSVA